MLEQEEMITLGKKEIEQLQQDISRLTTDNDAAKDEVRFIAKWAISLRL